METRKLTLEEDLKVAYCIDNWLRDEQIKTNLETVKDRLPKDEFPLRDDAIALVNFGPSLNDTWEEIKKFKYVMSCSGAHKFLVEHSITPTYHIDVDPREHKVMLMGRPCKDTEYLIANTCHPKLFEHLKDCNLKLWHIFDSTEEGIRKLPRGEWAITGGCSVGVRTVTVARFLGFRDLHVFGMDGCLRDGATHAMTHPNSTKKPCTLDYNGKTYFTTPSMLAAVKGLWHELDQLKDTTVKFYGDGLVQDMAKTYQKKEIKNSIFIGFNKPELISTSYAKLNEQLHHDNLAYGVGGDKHSETVVKLVKHLQSTRKENESEVVSVLDYGCGKGYLGKNLPFPIWEYDPAIPGKTEAPRPADLVVCTDVLEHIEPDKLHFVLDDLRRCTKRAGYFTINTAESTKKLADGRNAHLIVRDETFWRKHLGEHFFIPDNGMTVKKPMLFVIVAPLPNHRVAGIQLMAA